MHVCRVGFMENGRMRGGHLENIDHEVMGDSQRNIEQKGKKQDAKEN